MKSYLGLLLLFISSFIWAESYTIDSGSSNDLYLEIRNLSDLTLIIKYPLNPNQYVY